MTIRFAKTIACILSAIGLAWFLLVAVMTTISIIDDGGISKRDTIETADMLIKAGGLLGIGLILWVLIAIRGDRARES